MRHYEIVFIVHPDQSEQVPAMIERYRTIVTAERPDSPAGRLGTSPARLSDPESPQGALCADKHRVRRGNPDGLDHAFKFNDAILRHLTVKMDGPVTAPSPMMRDEKPKPATPPGEDLRETHSP